MLLDVLASGIHIEEIMEIEQGIDGTKPALDSYYQSIENAFETTLAVKYSPRHEYDGSSITIVFFFFLLFSLVPALPALAYFVSHWISKPLTLNVRGIHLSIHSFLFWYLALSAISALCFGVRLKYSSIRQKSSIPTIDTAELLTDAQMRFALCYSVKSEIDAYRTNKRSAHIEKARQSWRKLLRSLQEALNSGADFWIESPGGMMYPEWQLTLARGGDQLEQKHRERFFPQVHALLTQFSWFKLETRTESIILAFDGLRSKLSSRIRDKSDLFQVSKCLLPFGLYLYTQIPDISDTEAEKEKFAAFQALALDSFVQEMNSLSDYTIPIPANSKIESAAAKKAKVGGFLSATVGNPSPFLRFLSIWVTLQVIVGIAISTFLSTMKSLKFDSTLIALLIGSPFAIAAALTAIPVQVGSETQNQNESNRQKISG